MIFCIFIKAEPETIKICPDCNSTVVDGPVTVQKNFYSFRLKAIGILVFRYYRK